MIFVFTIALALCIDHQCLIKRETGSRSPSPGVKPRLLAFSPPSSHSLPVCQVANCTEIVMRIENCHLQFVTPNVILLHRRTPKFPMLLQTGGCLWGVVMFKYKFTKTTIYKLSSPMNNRNHIQEIVPTYVGAGEDTNIRVFLR